MEFYKNRYGDGIAYAILEGYSKSRTFPARVSPRKEAARAADLLKEFSSVIIDRMHSEAFAQSPAAFDPGTYLRATGEEFRRARKARSLSREALAERAGVHPNSVAVAERGSRDLNGMTKIRIYAALGVNHLDVELNRDVAVLGDADAYSPDFQVLGMPLASIAEDIGRAVREYRVRLGLRLEDVASSSGLHLNTLWNIERGLVQASGVSLHAIYIAMGVTRLTVRDCRLSLSSSPRSQSPVW